MACRDVWNTWPSGLRSPQNPPASPSGFVVPGVPCAMYFTHHGKPWLKPTIRHSTSCAGRRAAACGRAGRHNVCFAGFQYQPLQCRPYKWSISILPRSQFYKKQGKLAFSTSCTAVRPHRCLRNDAGTASDVTIGMWRHNQQATNHERNGKPWFSFPK